MDTKTILILGGYGNTGRPLSRLLLQESNTRLILAGRNIDKANRLTAEFNREFEGNRVCSLQADASNPDSLRKAFVGIDFVVVASSTAQYTQQVASAALEAKIGYLDVQYSTQKVKLLKSMAQDIRASGCCFITDGGFHPGLPAFLVRYVAQYFDVLESARVGSVIKEDWKHLDIEDSTINELMQLMSDYEMVVFKDGSWKKVSLVSTSDFVRMDFGAIFGSQFCAPMLLEEMRALPQLFPALKDTGFYVGSFNWFVDWVIMPVALVAIKIWPGAAIKPMGRWMAWGLKRFSKPPYGTSLKVEAVGKKSGHSHTVQLTIAHPDGYLFTAIPVAACLLQVLDGTIGEPGLWWQANIVNPDRFMSDMMRMGISMDMVEGGAGEVESN